MTDIDEVLYSCVVNDQMECYQISIHRTLKGAYKAGNKWLNDYHNSFYESRACIGKQSLDFMCEFSSFSIKKVIVDK